MLYRKAEQNILEPAKLVQEHDYHGEDVESDEHKDSKGKMALSKILHITTVIEDHGRLVLFDPRVHG